MRQAGVLAAAALVALDTGLERLADDHAHAAALAHAIAPRTGRIPFARTQLASPTTAPPLLRRAEPLKRRPRALESREVPFDALGHHPIWRTPP